MLQILKEHFSFRKQLFNLAKADLIKTYKGAALGWIWAIIKPAATVFVYWFVFSIGLRGIGLINQEDFAIWLIVGIVPWFYMTEMITQGTDSIRKYKYLVTKMKFPVSTVATFVSLSKMFVHLLLLGIVFIILLLKGYTFNIHMLQILYYIPLMFLFFVFWTLFSAPLAAISKDFSNLVKSSIRFIFWFSGIMYDPRMIDIPWIKNFLLANPVSYFAQGYRDTFLNQVWFWENPKSMIVFFITLFIMGLVGILTYNKLRKDIPDVL